MQNYQSFPVKKQEDNSKSYTSSSYSKNFPKKERKAASQVVENELYKKVFELIEKSKSGSVASLKGTLLEVNRRFNYVKLAVNQQEFNSFWDIILMDDHQVYDEWTTITQFEGGSFWTDDNTIKHPMKLEDVEGTISCVFKVKVPDEEMFGSNPLEDGAVYTTHGRVTLTTYAPFNTIILPGISMKLSSNLRFSLVIKA